MYTLRLGTHVRHFDMRHHHVIVITIRYKFLGTFFTSALKNWISKYFKLCDHKLCDARVYRAYRTFPLFQNFFYDIVCTQYMYKILFQSITRVKTIFM